MTGKEFIKHLVNGKKDILQILLDLLINNKINYCVIGGLAVNAYAEPVVSLDLDIVIAVKEIDQLIKILKKLFSIKKYPHSINLKSPDSDIRIQIQTDPQYQAFIPNAQIKNVLGYKMNVACLEDVLKGKIWAYSDKERRKSKKQKDLADIYRLVEVHPHLKKILPKTVKL